MDDRYEKGMKKFSEVIGKKGEELIAALQEVSPDMAKYIAEFAFGDVYSTGDELDSKERELIILSSLVTAGANMEIEVHTHAAVNVGVPPKKIIRMFLQCIPYVGFPKVIDAILIAKKVFSERKVKV